MSSNPSLRRSLPVFLMLAALVFTSLPIQAQPVLPSTAVVWRVAVLGEGPFAWFQEILASVRQSGMTKEGVTIDPDGQPHQGASSDEGMSIDPNG